MSSDVVRRWIITFGVCVVFCVRVGSTILTSDFQSKHSGYIGCLFSGSLCKSAEECYDDNLFGVCQTVDREYGTTRDDYKYNLSEDQLTLLYKVLQELVANGYSWRNRFTQCVLGRLLSAFRNDVRQDDGDPICEIVMGSVHHLPLKTLHADVPPAHKSADASLHKTSGFRGAVVDVNMSRHILTRPAPTGKVRDHTTTFGDYDKAFDEFRRFLDGLSADDLHNLKQFLMEETRASAKEVPAVPGQRMATPIETNFEVRNDLPSKEPSSVRTTNVEQRIDMGATQQTLFIAVSSDVSVLSTHTTTNTVVTDPIVNGPPPSKFRLLVYVLFGLTGMLVAVFIITCVQYCRAYRMTKQSGWKNLTDDEPPTDQYQDLCRQQMQSQTSETPDYLQTNADDWPKDDLGKLSSGVEISRTASSASMLSRKDDSVGPIIDIATGTLVLSYMEGFMKDPGRIQKEWDELCSSSPPFDINMFSPISSETTNVRKNLRADILPFEKNRVCLIADNNASGGSYINASFIVDTDPRYPSYITTQCPLPHTFSDFWQMVWEQGCSVIVNLSCLMEGSIPLCHRYWPESDSDLYHIYEVTLEHEHDLCDDYIVRNFTLRNSHFPGEVRNVAQFHFLSWPAVLPAVPHSAQPLLDFRRQVNKSFRGRSPIIVHCSDGVGRTGTYCLIDMVLRRIIKGVKEVDITATLEHLRDQRFDMVHTKEQFEFALTAVALEVHSILHPS